MAAVGAVLGCTGAVVYEAIHYWQGSSAVDKIANVASATLCGGVFAEAGRYLIGSALTSVVLLKQCLVEPERPCETIQYLYIGMIALPLICTIGTCLALFNPPREPVMIDPIEA